MAEQGKDASLPWPAIIGLITAIAGFVSFVPPLTSSRPSAPAPSHSPIPGAQNVDARLWQDPFQAVQSARASSDWNEADAQGRHTLDFARDLVRTANARLIAVVVSSSPFAENAESRIRTRQALVTALNWRGYAPVDGEHIGFFHWPTTGAGTGAEKGADKSQEVVVPFERWRPPGRPVNELLSRPDLLILWLNEDTFGDGALQQLNKLRSMLSAGMSKRDLIVIGPQHSDTLRDMLIEADRIGRDCSGAYRGITIYSPTATISERMLQSPRGSGTRDSSQILGDIGVNLCRTTATDDELCNALLEELQLRQIGPLQPMAIISEGDTTYARSLSASFGESVLSRGLATGGKRLGWPPHLHQFTYLRGIDGRLPGDPSTEKPARKDDSEISTLPGERPEGRDQADYLRRMVDELQRLDQSYRSTNARRDGLRAIGIFGSDVFDKLLVLRALRRAFPGAIFFTTDLDARLLAADESPYARNLIVASSFGLTLSPNLDSVLRLPTRRGRASSGLNIAPFRDTYQTACFLSSVLAVSEPAPKRISEKWGWFDLRNFYRRVPPHVHTAYPPRVFEIGRGVAVDLSTPVIDRSSGLPIDDKIHPDRRREFDVYAWDEADTWLILGLFLAALLVLVLHSFQRYLGVIRAYRTGRVLYFLLALLLVLAMIVWISDSNPHGEPFALFQGVSIWPTEIVRTVSFFLCVVLIFHMRRTLAASVGFCCKDLGLTTPTEEPISEWFKGRYARFLARRPRIAHRLHSLISGEPAPFPPRKRRWYRRINPRSIHVDTLWAEYCGLNSTRSQAWRVGIATAGYLLFGLALFRWFGYPHTPGRGPLSFRIDKIVMWFSVVAQIVLTFYVLDLMRLCRWFAEQLTKAPSRWPESLQTKVERERGMSGEDASEYLDVKLIATWTETIGHFVYYPFLILFLMIFSRNRYFDAWDWPIALIIVLCLNCAYTVLAYHHMRTAAESLRKHELQQLRDRLVKSYGDPDDARRDRLEQTIQEIENERRGAFASFLQQPIVAAILLPFSGFGIWAILQYVASAY